MRSATCKRCRRPLRADGCPGERMPNPLDWSGHELWCALMMTPPEIVWSDDERWLAGL